MAHGKIQGRIDTCVTFYWHAPLYEKLYKTKGINIYIKLFLRKIHINPLCMVNFFY